MSDERTLTWERMFEVAETSDETKQLWAMAKTTGELAYARAGFCRMTYAKEVKP